MNRLLCCFVAGSLSTVAAQHCLALDAAISPQEAREIARDAWIYGYPMTENYTSIYAWSLDKDGDQYKGPMNQVNNVPKVFGPKDTGVVTPNSDTPYSYLIMDLRCEPLVVTLPAIESDRYYSLQLVDLYSNNVDYLGTRRDGNQGGTFLIAGPDWKGATPAGIKRVVHSATAFMFSQFRTQLKTPDDIEKVKAIQAQYQVVPLSTYLKQSSPPTAPSITWPAISRDQINDRTFATMNLLFTYSAPLPSESALLKRFERIGISAGAAWPPALEKPVLEAIHQGQLDAEKTLTDAALKVTSSLDLFGTPEQMQGKYLQRAIGARLGLYGNTAAEALYPAWQLDKDGKPLDASKTNYQITFAGNQMPPVDAFWSITLYDGKTRFLTDNALNRYLINASMLPDLAKNPDGGITLYLQHPSPGADKQANWLPAPDGPIYVVMRLYLPKPEVLEGKWKAPAILER